MKNFMRVIWAMKWQYLGMLAIVLFVVFIIFLIFYTLHFIATNDWANDIGGFLKDVERAKQ